MPARRSGISNFIRCQRIVVVVVVVVVEGQLVEPSQMLDDVTE
jgi:hypothetical protein